MYPELISTRGEENEKSPRLSAFRDLKMRKRACVFVDGENLRHSLIGAFAHDGIFKPGDYLPARAQWASFFDWIVSVATGGTHDRLRAYWFASVGYCKGRLDPDPLRQASRVHGA